MRKIFEKQTVDFATGEVKSIQSLVNFKHNETFGMHRTTEGIDWVFGFTGNELQMLMVLLAIENPKNDLVEISMLKKEHLLKSFNFSKQMFNRILSSLEKKGALIRITNTDIMLNPSYFYQGGTVNWKVKYENFNYCKDKKFSGEK